jgi:HEAT repeat protein
MTLTQPAEAMPLDQSTALAEFARACKSAARSVSLYPGTHPAIAVALSRVASASRRLAAAGAVTLGVHPDTLVMDGRLPGRPDPAISELAQLLHGRLIGELRVMPEAASDDWHALLLILARAPDDVLHDGGVGKAWAAVGRPHLEIREIDYAEVLRERAGGEDAAWDRIIAFCLQGDAATLDDRALTTLLETVTDPDRLSRLIERLQASPDAASAGIGATAAALLQLLRTAVEAATARGFDTGTVLRTMATSMARLTPEMLLAVLARRGGNGQDAAIASSVIEQMNDDTIASFVANAVAADHGATERLAHAFEALVPESERKEQLLELAEDKARATDLGKEATFDGLWQAAAEMLTSYSDKKFVSDDYGRELTSAKSRAMEVERASDDPPERVQQWLQTISETALQSLDMQLLLDLLRIQQDATQWTELASIIPAEIERLTLIGDLDSAANLATVVLDEHPRARPQLAPVAAALAERLASGQLIRHVVLQLRKPEDGAVAAARLCHAIGSAVVRPLAEALAAEENNRVIRALREILLEFGASGRSSVEQLKNSTNPAVRRTAIDLLRVFGGNDALPELESMLGDADPQVQRESIRAIVQIGTDAAFTVLQRALVAGSSLRDTIVQQLIALRDDKAIPLLCYVLNHTPPRGTLAAAHVQIIEALGALHDHAESTQTLRFVLYRGIWWAPRRTSMLREAAAAALLRIGSPATTRVLEEAARSGSLGVRKIVRAKTAAPSLARTRG